MLNNILKSRRNFEWTIFHLLLGVFSTISEWFLIGWFYIIIISSINGIISSLIIHNSLNKVIPFIGAHYANNLVVFLLSDSDYKFHFHRK